MVNAHPNAKKFGGIYSLEGNISVGKTSGLRYLQQNCSTVAGLRVDFVDEPVNDWCSAVTVPHDLGPLSTSYDSVLDSYYKDPSKNAFLFQVEAFSSRTKSLLDAIRSGLDRGEPFIIVTERSFFSDRGVFAKQTCASGFMSGEEAFVYSRFFDFVTSQVIEFYRGMLYLCARPSICFERMQRRNRKQESPVPLSYLQGIHDRHQEMVASPNVIAVTIDWENTLEKACIELKAALTKLVSLS